jgi:hypothetical protein
LEDWSKWAKAAASIATATTSLRQRVPCSVETMDALLAVLPLVRPRLARVKVATVDQLDVTHERALTEQRALVAATIEGWLDLGDVAVSVTWPPPDPSGRSTPRLGYHGDGLFAALGVALALNLSNAKGLYICDHCGCAYTRIRAPQAGKRGYCDDCKQKGAQASWRASRARREETSAAPSTPGKPGDRPA